MPSPVPGAFPDAIETLLYRGDVEGVVALVGRLQGAERQAASSWFETSGRLFDRIRSGRDRLLPGEQSRYLESRAHYYDWTVHVAWSEVVGGVALLPPVAAARRVALRRIFSRAWPTLAKPEHSEVGRAACRSVMVRRGPEWVKRFVDALAADRRTYPEELGPVIHDLLAEFDLPAPTGPGYVDSWLIETYIACRRRRVDDPPPPTWLEVLRAHRYTPVLLPLTLAVLDRPTGDTYVPAVATLVEEGVVDRSAVLTELWTCLDPPRSPGVQRTFRALIRALHVEPDEVTGGLPSLLGVLATSSTGLCTEVLPLAVRLVPDRDGLADLTATVASRPGKAQRTALLAALTAADLQERLGLDAVLDALRVLGDTEDLQLAARVGRAVTALAPSGAPRTDAGPERVTEERMGLWDLPLQTTWPRLRNGHAWGEGWTPESVVVDAFCRTDFDQRREETPYVDALAVVLDGDELPPGAVLAIARRLLATGDLHLPRVVRAMEDLFLAGVMRHVWEDALHLAGLLCVAPRRSATLNRYLRMLSGYVLEAPPDGRVPEGVALLAGSRGSSAAHLEARRLARALRESMGDAPPVDGGLLRPPPLWADGPAAPITSVDVRVEPAATNDLDAWLTGDLARLTKGRLAPMPSVPPGPRAIVDPGLVLASLVSATHEHGVPAVWEGLGRIFWWSIGEHVVWHAGLRLWGQGGLTPDLHWDLALHTQTYHDWARAVENGSASAEELAWVTDPRRYRGWDAEEREVLHLPRPIVRVGTDHRVRMLLWSESLQRAVVAPSLLSTPEYLDGTLDLHTLLARLDRARDVGVGAVDLAVALHRVRPLPADAPRPARPAPVIVDPWTLAPPGEPPVRLDALDVVWRQLETGRRDWGWVRALRRHLVDGWGTASAGALEFNPLDIEMADDPHGPFASRALLRTLAYSQAPLGPRAHEIVLRSICLGRPADRFSALGDVRGVLVQARLQPGPAVTALRRLRAGEPAYREPWGSEPLPVVRSFTDAFSALIAQGHLRELWPIGLAVAEDVCFTDPDADGLADLLDVLTRFVPEVPVTIDPPQSVRARADAASGDVADAARRFLAAVRAAATAPAERTDDRARAAS